MVYAQHQLATRLAANGGRPPPQPHFEEAVRANGGRPITAFDYLQLQLRIHLDKSEVIPKLEPGAQIDPRGHMRYTCKWVIWSRRQTVDVKFCKVLVQMRHLLIKMPFTEVTLSFNSEENWLLCHIQVCRGIFYHAQKTCTVRLHVSILKQYGAKFYCVLTLKASKLYRICLRITDDSRDLCAAMIPHWGSGLENSKAEFRSLNTVIREKWENFKFQSIPMGSRFKEQALVGCVGKRVVSFDMVVVQLGSLVWTVEPFRHQNAFFRGVSLSC